MQHDNLSYSVRLGAPKLPLLNSNCTDRVQWHEQLMCCRLHDEEYNFTVQTVLQCPQAATSCHERQQDE